MDPMNLNMMASMDEMGMNPYEQLAPQSANVEDGYGAQPLETDPGALDADAMEQESDCRFEGQARSSVDPNDPNLVETLRALLEDRMKNRINASQMFQQKARELNQSMRRGY